MSISVISFTENGIRLSRRLRDLWKAPRRSAEWGDILLYTKCKAAPGDGNRHYAGFVEQSVAEWAGEQMRRKNALLFIGACGIAVRAVAPSLTDKLHDSPVLVMDEGGRYVIPILSGHWGGANELAGEIAGFLGAVAVITTATDLNRKFAVDLFARKNGLTVANKDGIAKVSARVLAGEEITLSVEAGHFDGAQEQPAGVRLAPYPPEQAVDVLVAAEAGEAGAALWLRPREYVIGMGCKRGKEAEKIEKFIGRSIREAGIEEGQLFALASIDRKKDEPGLLQWSREKGRPFLTYTAEQLRETAGEYQGSDFVREKVGVDNVCERAAVRACGAAGKLVYGKHAEDGMTIAIAKREWRVAFDEE